MRGPRSLAAALAAALAVGCASPSPPAAPPAPRVEAPLAPDEAHRRYGELVGRWLDLKGRVDYEGLHGSEADMAALDAYVRDLLGRPPTEEPLQYPTPTARLVYWLNLYNALVIRELARRWPVESVQDIESSATVFAGPGRAFFYDLVFDVGAQSMSLLDIENQILRIGFAEPRAYFALSCGTRSSPALAQRVFRETSLDNGLEQGTARFVNTKDNVVVDHGSQTIRVSPLLGWYRPELEALAEGRSEGATSSLEGFLLMYAWLPLAAQLQPAILDGYQVQVMPYDWTIDPVHKPRVASTGPKPRRPIHIPKELIVGPPTELKEPAPMPELSFAKLDGEVWTPSMAKGKVMLVDFWATWCRPCLISFPGYQVLHRRHADKGLLVVAVSQDERRQPVDDFARANKVSLQITLDPDHQVTQPPLNVQSLPTVVLVDRKGMMRYRHEGYSQPDLNAIEDQVLRLIEEE